MSPARLDAPRKSAEYYVCRIDGGDPGGERRWSLTVEATGPASGEVCLLDDEGEPAYCERGAFGVLWSVLQHANLGVAAVTALLIL